MKYLLLVICAAALAAGCAKKDEATQPGVVNTADLLPKESEISSWSRQSGSDAGWFASNTTQLSEKIDGGFELFANHGFVEAGMQKYSGTVNAQPNVELEVQIYQQGSEANANGVFDDPNNAFANPIAPKNPPSARAQITRDIFSFTMKFARSKYYARLIIFSADDKAQDVLEVFAGNIAAKIK